MSKLKIFAGVGVFVLCQALVPLAAQPAKPGGAQKGAPSSAPAQVSAVARLAALHVARPSPGSKPGQPTLCGLPPGTWVHLEITCTGGCIVGLSDDNPVQPSTFGDDAGTDMLKRDAGGQVALAYLVRLTEEGEASFSLGTEQLPSPEAKALVLKGRMTLACASEPKTVDLAPFVMQKNVRMVVGPMNITVSNIADNADGGQTLTLSCDKNIDVIKQFVFLDGAKAIEAHKAGSARVAQGHTLTYVLNLTVPQKLARIGAKVTYFQKLQKVDVPLDFTARLSL